MSWFRFSRRRIVLLTVGVLLLLDVGRSINARLGLSEPVELWQPDPAVYADLTWPPGSDLAPETPVGRRVFVERCAVCHGPDGRGNGPAAPSLIPHPRNFAEGTFKYKSTPAGQPPLERDLVRTVSHGLRASAMPYFHDLLSDAEIRAVVRYIQGLSSVFTGPLPHAVTIPPRIPPDAESLARGKALYTQYGCVACHGPEARGGLPFQETTGYPVISRDLTAPWTFRGGSDPEQVWLRVTTGLAPGPMPAFESALTPDQRWDVVNYILSLARVPPWEPGGRLNGPGHDPDLLKRGRYLVHAQMCGICHTQTNPIGIYRGDDFYLAGGMRVGVYPHGVYIARNLTPDDETGLGTWTEDEIATALRTGRTPDRLLNPWAMIWAFFHSLTDDDALAIARYLKSRPAVRNHIPPPLHYGVLETLAVKLAGPLPEGRPRVLTYTAGNYGQPNSAAYPDLPQRLLIWGQGGVLLAGLLAFLFAGPRGRRFPKNAKGWLLAGLAATGIGVGGLVGAFLYFTPTLHLIPAEEIAAGVTVGMPQIDPAALRSPEQVALAKRGQYLYKIVSCNNCHGPDGSGGQKISWRPAGSHWTRNLTPDHTAGIGAWSDREISRAIRSGVARDGRPLHWQGMVWDHASNLDEEDVRALIAYLRSLPPVTQAVPPFRPPDGRDCARATVYLIEDRTPGCS